MLLICLVTSYLLVKLGRNEFISMQISWDQDVQRSKLFLNFVYMWAFVCEYYMYSLLTEEGFAHPGTEYRRQWASIHRRWELKSGSLLRMPALSHWTTSSVLHFCFKCRKTHLRYQQTPANNDLYINNYETWSTNVCLHLFLFPSFLSPTDSLELCVPFPILTGKGHFGLNLCAHPSPYSSLGDRKGKWCCCLSPTWSGERIPSVLWLSSPSWLLEKSVVSSSICQGHSQGGTDLVLALTHVLGLPTVGSESGQLVTLITKNE